MRMSKSISIFSIAILPACAIRPAPAEVTRIDTFTIVTQIRCEAREAIKKTLIAYLTKGRGVDEFSRGVGDKLAAKTKDIETFKPAELSGEAEILVSKYWLSGIAYNFQLDMKVETKLSASTQFLDKFPAKIFSLSADGGLDRFRQNIREFTVTDTVGELVAKEPGEGCTGLIRGPNYAYPIAGQIGIESMMQGFVYLSLLGNLDSEKGNSGHAPTIAETLNFQTVISGKLAPKITFSPIPNDAFRLAEASVTAEAIRTDLHSVVIGLSLPEAGNADFRKLRGEYNGDFVSASGSPTELNAARAAEQSIARKVFQPIVQINN